MVTTAQSPSSGVKIIIEDLFFQCFFLLPISGYLRTGLASTFTINCHRHEKKMKLTPSLASLQRHWSWLDFGGEKEATGALLGERRASHAALERKSSQPRDMGPIEGKSVP